MSKQEIPEGFSLYEGKITIVTANTRGKGYKEIKKSQKVIVDDKHEKKIALLLERGFKKK